MSDATQREEIFKMPEGDAMLTPRQMSQLCACSDDTVRRAVKNGDLPPPLMICGSRRWPKAVIVKFLESADQPQPRRRSRRVQDA